MLSVEGDGGHSRVRPERRLRPMSESPEAEAEAALPLEGPIEGEVIREATRDGTRKKFVSNAAGQATSVSAAKSKQTFHL